MIHQKMREMKNVQDIVDDGKCLGCAACCYVCPNGYIEFKESENSKLPVPTVANCDDCGICLKACPASDRFEI